MCGRVFDPEEVSETKLNPLKGRAGDRWLWTMPRRYNVPPTMPLPVMTSRDGVRTVEPMRWGLIPSWSKDMKGGFSTFNARADGPVRSRGHTAGFGNQSGSRHHRVETHCGGLD
jgi:putative SOS response-associated peptidase YedK